MIDGAPEISPARQPRLSSVSGVRVHDDAALGVPADGAQRSPGDGDRPLLWSALFEPVGRLWRGVRRWQGGGHDQGENVLKRVRELHRSRRRLLRGPPGTVTGFLGPNGAGKSTTMRIMVGLTPPRAAARPSAGSTYRDIPNPGRHVGVLLDASAQHAGRTGREVLGIGARTMGLPASRVDEMLELVGLNGAESKRRVRNYSLGMRQRLGIAHALLGDPSVLILDEPANGLDPAGIRWMRGLLTQFADQGGTVLLSTHLLHEVELIADEMILIGRGKIVAQGTRDELLQTARAPSSPPSTTPRWPRRSRSRDRRHAVRRRPAAREAEPVDVGRAAAEGRSRAHRPPRRRRGRPRGAVPGADRRRPSATTRAPRRSDPHDHRTQRPARRRPRLPGDAPGAVHAA